MNNSKSGILDWLWGLAVAPSRTITLTSPYPPSEVLRRLRSQSKIVQIVKSSQLIVCVPSRSNPRRFLALLDSSGTSKTRLIGRMQTPYRVALFRMSAFIFLFLMAIVWLQVGRIWLGVIFLFGGVGFLLSSQYERLIGRDLRTHLEWLHRILDTEDRH